MPRSTRRTPKGFQPSDSASLPVENNVGDIDYSSMDFFEILNCIVSKNTDPAISRMLEALQTKIPQLLAEAANSDKKNRSLVVAGLPESPPDWKPSEKQKDLESKVGELLDALKTECRPVEAYRMGVYDGTRPRLVKLLLPTRRHWTTALSNARLLKSSGFSGAYVRKSLSFEERRKEYELRQEAKRRNSEANRKSWVVYRGALANVDDLAQRSSGNSSQIRISHQT